MTFFQTSQRQVSRRTNFARPCVEGCERRQLIAGTVAARSVGCMLRSVEIRGERLRSNHPGCQLKGEER